MNISKYIQASSNVFEEKQLLKFGFISLLVLTLVNWYSVDNASKREKVVVVPPGAAGEIWVTSESVSEDYVISVTRYILKMIGDYTVRTARMQFNDLLTLYKPKAFGEAKRNFDLLATEIEKFQSAAQHIEFAEQDILHDPQNKKIKVKVKRYRYINGVNSGSEVSTVMIEYVIENGRFFITQILEEKYDAT